MTLLFLPSRSTKERCAVCEYNSYCFIRAKSLVSSVFPLFYVLKRHGAFLTSITKKCLVQRWILRTYLNAEKRITDLYQTISLKGIQSEKNNINYAIILYYITTLRCRFDLRRNRNGNPCVEFSFAIYFYARLFCLTYLFHYIFSFAHIHT